MYDDEQKDSQMNEDNKLKLKEFFDASIVISDYLTQQVRNGSINQALYKKNIQRFVEALNQVKEMQNDWK